MKHSIKTIVGFSFLIMMALSVIAATSINFLKPNEFTTFTSTSIIYNLTYNQTTNAETYWNVRLYNSSNSSSDRLYQVLGEINVSNATHSNLTFTMLNGGRFWWYFNVTNMTGGAVVSDVRIFDVDVAFLKFKFGGFDALNFTLDSGRIDAKTNITAKGVQLRNASYEGDVGDCGDSNKGTLLYNGTNDAPGGGLLFCVNATWKVVKLI